MSADQITQERIAIFRRRAHNGKITADEIDHILDALTAYRAEVQALRKDMEDAAGELLIEIPEPGSVASKMLMANVLMRRERDTLRSEVQRLTEELNRALGPTNRQLHEEAAGMPLDDVFFRMSGIDPEGRRPAAVQGVELPDIPSTPPKGLARERFPGRDEDRERMGFVDGWQECREWFASRLSPSPQPATGAVVIRDPDDDDWDAFGFQQGTRAEVLRVWNRALATCKDSLQVPQPSADVVGPSWLVLAGIGRKHFGNPIPQAWYAAARELIDAISPSPQHSADVVVVPREECEWHPEDTPGTGVRGWKTSCGESMYPKHRWRIGEDGLNFCPNCGKRAVQVTDDEWAARSSTNHDSKER